MMCDNRGYPEWAGGGEKARQLEQSQPGRKEWVKAVGESMFPVWSLGHIVQMKDSSQGGGMERSQMPGLFRFSRPHIPIP